MIRLDVANFRNLRDVHLHDDGQMSIIVGLNEAGKSSLVGAMQFVLKGEAFNHRGAEASKLVTHGEDRMHIRLNVGDLSINRTQSTGDSLKGIAERLSVPVDVLPLLFDAKLCGDGGNKAMRAFLDGVASSKFDAAIHFATDPVVSNCVTLAKRSGKITTKQIIQYCESMRALQKKPAQPVLPSVPRPSAAEIAASETALNASVELLGLAVSACREYDNNARCLLQIAQYKADLVEYLKKSAEASKGDALTNRTELQRISAINLAPIQAAIKIFADAAYLGVSSHGQDFIAAATNVIAQAKEKLAANPAPIGAPRAPVVPAEAQTLYDLLVKDGRLDDESLNTACLIAANEGDQAQAIRATTQTETETLKQRHTVLIQNQGAWQAYDNAVPAYETGCAKADADWAMWDTSAKLIAEAETKHINTAGDAFGKMVSEFGEFVLQGRKIAINRDTGITLNGVDMADCTESTKWRIEVCIMAAVARTLNSPLLLIDAADILDDNNKQALQGFLIERIAPHFRHIVITSTCRGRLEDEKASPDKRFTKWILKNGDLQRLATAATA